MEEKMKILIVEDDETLAEEITGFLGKWGYETKAAKNFGDIADEFMKYSPHLVLMDINLPFFDGFYWCKKIRQVSEVPIIYISSRDDDRDKIMAIAQGGDDYVEKPFHLELLKAKMDAILRRTYQYKVRDRGYLGEELYFDYGAGTCIFQNKRLELTKSEKKIMSKLLEAKPCIVTREELMMELWSTDEFVSDGTLTTMVSRMRGKLKEFCGKDIICTKKGQGYYIE